MSYQNYVFAAYAVFAAARDPAFPARGEDARRPQPSAGRQKCAARTRMTF
jgi:hypothetical protein